MKQRVARDIRHCLFPAPAAEPHLSTGCRQLVDSLLICPACYSSTRLASCSPASKPSFQCVHTASAGCSGPVLLSSSVGRLVVSCQYIWHIISYTSSSFSAPCASLLDFRCCTLHHLVHHRKVLWLLLLFLQCLSPHVGARHWHPSAWQCNSELPLCPVICHWGFWVLPSSLSKEEPALSPPPATSSCFSSFQVKLQLVLSKIFWYYSHKTLFSLVP